MAYSKGSAYKEHGSAWRPTSTNKTWESWLSFKMHLDHGVFDLWKLIWRSFITVLVCINATVKLSASGWLG